MSWIDYLQSCKVSHVNDATHLSMIGGKYNFTNKKLFHTMYSIHLSEASTHCLMECVRYPIRFFIDIDRCVHVNVHECVRTSHSECVICFNGEDGYHLIFPTIIVTSKEDAIVQMNMWRDSPLFAYMDASVYATGLRIIGAHKSKETKRIYNPMCWLHPDGDRYDRTSAYHPNMLWLQACSIQTPESVHGSRTTIRSGSNHISTATTFSFERLDQHYTNVPVYRFENKNKRYIHVLTYEKYCTNVQRHHTNQHVYFVIDCQQKTITQRCFGCKHGCAKYKSKYVKLPLKTFYTIYNKIWNL